MGRRLFPWERRGAWGRQARPEEAKVRDPEARAQAGHRPSAEHACSAARPRRAAPAGRPSPARGVDCLCRLGILWCVSNSSCMQGPPPEESELPIMLPAMEPAMLEAWCAVGAQSGSTTDGGAGGAGVGCGGSASGLACGVAVLGVVPWCPSCPFPGAPPLPLPAARPRRRAAARVRPRPRARPRGQRWCFGSESSQAEAEAALVQQVRPSSCQNPCHGQGLA